jgi:DNA-directed RNA polymerase specialized sigma24 family protein
MLREVKPMVYNFSRKFTLEFEDLMQEAALIMLKVWPKIPPEAPIKAYLHGSVKRRLYKILRHKEDMLSLDMPVTEDSQETFADMLQAFVEQDTQRADHVAKVVHTALRKLSLEVQLHTMTFYGLNSYKPALPRISHKVVYGRQKRYMRESLKTAFRRDSQILSLFSN